ncbi:MAG TPA: GGDEF domain-containing protein [Oligoflexia bacterium]|nr:GGDEF domain-containing protein [Oligoflexia bacterium]HMR23904.1 GGDEF domain-containing protein [Oligoflexia bacterium]
MAVKAEKTDERTVRKDVQDLLNKTSGLKAYFVVITGQDIGKKFPIQKSELSIGRSEACDIYVNDEDVSRNHALIKVLPSGIIIEDLESTNGTLVNGQAIAKKTLLDDGDRIQVGNVTVFKFHFLDELEENYNEQLYKAANKDYLTGCYNKKYFTDRLKMEISHTKRHQSPLSLMIFDVDHFKKFNDTHGHVTGDIILQKLAEEIDSIKRHEDLFARYGGEEFILLLRDTPQERAVQIAEKIRAHIADLAIEVEGQKLGITISIGVETFTGKNYQSEEDFLRGADHLLYEAKRAGRNKVYFEKHDA